MIFFFTIYTLSTISVFAQGENIIF